MSDLSDMSIFGCDYGFATSPLQRRLSTNSGYDYDGLIESQPNNNDVAARSRSPLSGPMSASQPIISSRPKNSTRDLSSAMSGKYSYYDGPKKAWEDDGIYGLGAQLNRTPFSNTPLEASPAQLLPENVSSRHDVGDLSRAFFTQMNKDVPQSQLQATSGLAAMYERSIRKPKPLTQQDSVRLRKEVSELARADPEGFYDISDDVRAPPVASRAVKMQSPETAGKPLMRDATVSWDSVPEIVLDDADKKDGASSGDDLMAEMYTDNAIQAVVAVVEKESKEGEAPTVTAEEPVPGALASRPASLDPRRIYTGVPELAPSPILRREEPVAIGKRRNSQQSLTSAANSSAGAYEADEVMRVSYASGETQQSGVLELLRIHFLSGHNAMVAVTCTQRCNAIAEDFVATTVSTVFRQAHSMGPQFTNEFALSAYALLPNEQVSNVLPTTEKETTPELIGLAANPVSGTVIHNYRPVQVANEGEATYLGRAAIHNARVLGFDPYVDENAMMCVALHLKQTRSSADVTVPGAAHSTRSITSAKKTAATEADAPHEVYVACLKILFLGSNVEALMSLLNKEPEGLWPLVRQSFGGCCRTCITIFIDRDDPGAHAERVLKLAETLRDYDNEAPRSGSVRKFLKKVHESSGDEMSMHDSVSMNRFREDAEDLVRNSDALPAFYPLPGTRGRVRKTESSAINTIAHAKTGLGSREDYETASRVIVLEATKPLSAKEEQAPKPVSPPSVRSPLRLLSPPELVVQKPSVQTVIVPAKPRQIVIENSPRALAPEETETGADDIRIDMPTNVRIREHDARKMESTRRKLQEATAEKWPTLRMADSIRSGDTAAPSQSVANRLRDEWENSKHYSSVKTLPDPSTPFRTVVLLFNGSGDKPAAAGENPAAFIQRTDDTHVLLTMPPQPPKQESVKCRFQVDEVRSATADVDETVGLMLSFSSLERLQEAFTVKQMNAALLVTDITGYIQPFRSQPVWAAFHSTLHNALQLRQSSAELDDALPFKITLFASVLRGKKLLKDLVLPLCAGADATANETITSSLAANRSYGDAGNGGVRIGISPVFGSLLYETRGVDLEDSGVVASYLTSILQLADDVATDDPEVYVVMTCVQQTAMRLSRSELTSAEIEEGRMYDARFSSYTLISTRGRVDMFEHGIQGNPTTYPIQLFQDALQGKLKTVYALTVDEDQADPECTMRAMLMQHKAKTLSTTRYQIRKEQSESGVPRSPSQSPRTLAHRHNSVRAYVMECESASRSLRQRIAENAESGVLSAEDCAELTAKADTYDELARQHMVYLTEPCDYELLTYRAASPGALATDASQLVEPVSSINVANSQRSTPAATPKRPTAAAPPAAPSAAPAVASRALDLPPSPHSTKRSTPATVAPNSASVRGPGLLLSPDSLQSGGDSSRRPPTKLNSLASTKAPSARDSADGLNFDAAAAEPRSLIQERTERSVDTVAPQPSRHLYPGEMNPAISPTAPQLTPQPLPAEAGLTSRSIVLFATDVALTTMMRRLQSQGTNGTPASASVTSTQSITITETSRAGELILTTGTQLNPMQQDFKFDDIICLAAATEAATHSNLSESRAEAGTAMPPAIPTGVNPNSLFKSPVLVAGLQGFLAGSNVAIVLQETVEAAKTTLLEQLVRMIVSVCTRERPSEATLFYSASFVKDGQSTDLLDNKTVSKPVEMSFSPLAGPFISSSTFRTLWTPQEGQDAVSQTLNGDKALTATQHEHLLVVTIWQKLVVEAEGDVSLSSITIVVGRDSAATLRRYLKDTTSPLKVLLRYVLGGPCYTICGSCVTDAEQGGAALGEKNTAFYMLAYQTSQLCNVSGRPVVCNSYRDLFRYHNTQLKKLAASMATLSTEIQLIEKKMEAEGSNPSTQDSLAKRKKKLAAMQSQTQRFTEMVRDESAVLKSASAGSTKEQHSAMPPYYSAIPS